MNHFAQMLFVLKARLELSQARSGWDLPPPYISVLKGQRKPPFVNFSRVNPSSLQDEFP
jgi:hypothetical protein